MTRRQGPGVFTLEGCCPPRGHREKIQTPKGYVPKNGHQIRRCPRCRRYLVFFFEKGSWHRLGVFGRRIEAKNFISAGSNDGR